MTTNMIIVALVLAIQQCADAMKRMGEAIGKMGVKLPIDKED